MGINELSTKIGNFMQTPGDKAVFERTKSGLFVGKLLHNGNKKSFVQYKNGTIVETIVKKAIKG